MFISVDKGLVRLCVRYTAASAFTALFGAVYELFSHEVYSYYMIYAFAIPLVLGTIPTLCFMLSGDQSIAKSAGHKLNGYAAAVLTTGSVAKGVLDIYGTTNSLMRIYLYAGSALLAAAIIVFFKDTRKSREVGA